MAHRDMADQKVLTFKTMLGKKSVSEVDRKELDLLMNQLIASQAYRIHEPS